MKRALLLFLVLLQFFSTAHAVIGRKLPIASLAQTSDYIVTGRVVEVRSVLTQGEIWTIVTLSVEEPLKGSRRSAVRFRIPGGEQKVQGRTLVTRVEGAPVMNLNERALLFLSNEQDGTFDLSGLGQGYWRVEVRDGSEMAVPSDVEGASGLPLRYMRDQVRESMRFGKVEN